MTTLEEKREARRLYQIEYRKNPANREKAREACRVGRKDPEKKARYNETSRLSVAKTRSTTEGRKAHNASSLASIQKAMGTVEGAARLKATQKKLQGLPHIVHGNRMSAMKLSYGLTETMFQDLMNTQKGCCAICGRDFGSLNRRAAVEHCHTTGKVRGIVCDKCNVAIGRIEYLDIDKVKSYLNRPHTGEVYSKKKSAHVTEKVSCELCGSSEHLRVDHCHDSGYIRGVLCNKCNIGLSAVESTMFPVYVEYLA